MRGLVILASFFCVTQAIATMRVPGTFPNSLIRGRQLAVLWVAIITTALA